MLVKETSTPQQIKTRAESFYPKLPDPPKNEDSIRLVHVTPRQALNSIFSEGLKLPCGIEGHTRGFAPSEKLALVDTKESFGLFTHPKSGDHRYRYGVAVIIDMPNDTHKIFRSFAYQTENIPTEFIKGAITRSGKWIENPNYSANFVYQAPALTQVGPNRRVNSNVSIDTVATVKLLVQRDTDVSPHDVW